MTYMANTILTEGKTPSIPTPPSPPTKPIGDVKVKLGLTPTIYLKRLRAGRKKCGFPLTSKLGPTLQDGLF